MEDSYIGLTALAVVIGGQRQLKYDLDQKGAQIVNPR
jgi:hypothetical protein